MLIKTEQNNALNNSIVPENQAVLNPVSLTQIEIEQSGSVKNTLVSEGHELYIENFNNLKRVETVNLKFLRLLNYDLQDTIYARAIEKLTEEEKKRGQKTCPPKNIAGKLGDILPKLKDCNENKNQNVYFVVNGGGQKGKDVKVGRALMLEIDKDEQGNLIPIHDQYQIMVDKFGIPTVAIFTGNKSLHCYYTYEEPIDTNLWQQMQEDALAYCPIADQLIKDLPRVLRLVGFKHSETGKYSEVYAESGIKYSYDELRSKIPVRTVETEKKKPVVKAQKAQKATKLAAPNTASKLSCPPSHESVISSAALNITEDAQRIIEAGTDKNGLLIAQNLRNHRFIEFDADDYVEILPLDSLVRLLEIKTALEVLDTKICDDYDTWLNIGMALHHQGSTNDILDFSEAMRELFHAWSQGSDKYDEMATEAKWDSFSNHDNSVKINTLFYHAHQKVDNVERLARNIYPLFEAVAGLEYYRSHLGSIDRDSLAKMHRAIIIELAEISATFGKVKNEALKNFITERIDTFRRPYGYTDLDHPRRFVFGGSTNDDEFLTDPTGSRRYWVLEINEMIDSEAIAQYRDEIFRAAYILKLYGEQPYLNPEESTINENRNKAHKKVTLLDEAIAEIVGQRAKNHEKVKGTPVEKTRFQIPFLSNDLVNDLRQGYPTLKPTPHGIKAALQSIGFEQVQKRVNGKAGRWWQPTDKYYELRQEEEDS